MALSPGTRLGPYEVTAKLGEGGMGEVYRATDSHLKRSVAIKVLPASVAGDADRLARFQREAEVLAALNHPNIAQIYGLEKTSDVTALVMELVEGRDLSEVLAGGAEAHALHITEALPIAKQIAEALEAAHDQGIVHRDLKPANIKVRADGTVKVLDFGLAKALDRIGAAEATPYSAANSPTMTSPAMTAMGMILGTAAYMSPQQAKGHPVDRRADIWALGVVLFEMLAGRRPFGGETITETMALVITQPPDWHALPQSTPAPIRRLLQRCLDKDPKRRYQSAGDVRLDIDEILAGPGEAADALRPDLTTNRRLPAAALAIVALLGLAGTLTAALWPRVGGGPSAQHWTGSFLGGPALAYAPRLSPDGRMLAFQAVIDGLSQVAVMHPERGNWSVLTHERDAGFVEFVAWSADGAGILFSRRNGQSIDSFSVPALGGAPRLVLANAVAPQALADGRVAFLRPNADRRTQLHLLDPGTGDVRPLNAIVVAVGDVGVPAIPYRVFPDGRAIVFYGVPAEAAPTASPAVYVLDVATNTVELTAEFPATVVNAVAVDPRDRSLLVSLIGGDGQQVVRLSPDAGMIPVPVLSMTDRSGLMDVAPDGSVYLDQVQRPMRVLRFATQDRTPPVVADVPIGRATVSAVLELPDGRLLTTDFFDGRARLLVITAAGEARPFVESAEATSGPATLAGSGRVAFVHGSAPNQAIALATISDGRIVQRLPVDAPGIIRGLTASPEGDQLFYAAGGSVWSVPSTGGPPTRLGEGDAVAFDPRRGDLVVQLFSADGAGAQLARMPATGGAGTPIVVRGQAGLASPSALGPYAVRADGAIAVTVAVNDSWFFRPGVLDPETGILRPVALGYDGDFFSVSWNRNGEMIAGAFPLRTGIWRFRPDR